MNIEELTALASQIEAAAREAGAMMLGAEADKSVSTKSGRKDLVTRYDKEIQRFLEERLLSLLPEAGSGTTPTPSGISSLSSIPSTGPRIL